MKPFGKKPLDGPAAAQAGASEEVPVGMDADSFLASIMKLGGHSNGNAQGIEVFDAGTINTFTPELARKTGPSKDEIVYVPKAKNRTTEPRLNPTRRSQTQKAEREPTKFGSFLRRGANSLQKIRNAAEETAQRSGREGSASDSGRTSPPPPVESAAEEARKLLRTRKYQGLVDATAFCSAVCCAIPPLPHSPRPVPFALSRFGL